MRCRICDNIEGNKRFVIREMMFGLKEEFVYFQCSNCQCMQAAEILDDLTKYYPTVYYDLMSGDTDKLPVWPVPDWCATMTGGPLVTHFEVFRNLDWDWDKILTERVVEHYLTRAGIKRDANILDVGTANGEFLRSLRRNGFTGSLVGIEPYIEENIEFDDDVTIVKGTIQEAKLDGKFDLITFHHSFEHVPNPLEVLQAASQLLSEDGVCLIRTPIVPCYAFEHYGVNWVSLDVPRHYFIPSPESVRILAEKSNLRLDDILYDSTPLQFWGSEQYTNDLPFYAERSFAVNPFDSIFPLLQIRLFEKRAEELNGQNRGDQAAFYLSLK